MPKITIDVETLRAAARTKALWCYPYGVGYCDDCWVRDLGDEDCELCRQYGAYEALRQLGWAVLLEWQNKETTEHSHE